MKKFIKRTIVFIIIILAVVFMSKTVKAVDESKLKIKIETDVSEAIENKKIYAYISLIEFNNVQTSEPMAMTGTLNYDESIFESVEVEGLNNWHAEYNSESKKILLDASSIIEDDNIIKITFNVKDVSKSFSTDIKITDIELSNDVDVDMSGLNLNSRVSITVEDENNSNQEPNNPDDNNNNEQNPDNGSNEENNDDNNNEENNNLNDEDQNSQNNDNNQEENTNNNQNNQENDNKEPDKIEKVEDLTTSKDPLPQTGVSYTIFGVIIAVFVLGVLAFIGFRRIEK